MNGKYIIGILILLGITATAYILLNYSREDVLSYSTYANERYEYEIDYPSTLEPQRMPTNDDGQVFSNKDVSLQVFGIQNIDNDALRTVAEEYIANPAPAIVRSQTSNSIVIEDLSGERVSIVKVIALNEGRVGVLVLEYENDVLDEDETDRILDSFHVIELRNDTTQNEDSKSFQGDYTTYLSEDLHFSILRPEDSTVNQETDTRIKFTYLGPKNDFATEITDGFTVTVHRDPNSEQFNSVDQYAESVYPANAITDLEERQVNGYTAYRYTARTQLGGSVTTYVFLPTNNQGYTVTYNVTDPNGRGYENIVSTMLESIQFIPEGMALGIPI